MEKRLGLVELTEETAGERISEETVMEVAGAWSLDPRELPNAPTSSVEGIYGELPRPFDS